MKETPMAASVKFYNVGNGDMSLITLESGKTVLVDVNITAAADDPNDEEYPDVFSHLLERLPTDDEGRPYVDAFLLTHPDADHCRGLEEHFHLGTPETHDNDTKVLIREMWSSPIVFRRKVDIEGGLCADAQAWKDEARRRVKRYREGQPMNDGNRIQILGKDRDGKTDDIMNIVVEVGQHIQTIGGTVDSSFTAKLLGPLSSHGDDAEREKLAKNNSSVIVQFVMAADGNPQACKLLMGGDAEVAIWERLWDETESKDDLKYNILLAPHHCSWHSLSYESWGDTDGEAEVNPSAYSALSQTEPKVFIVASSNAILDDENDPPCIGAKWAYEDIASAAGGDFYCVSEVAVDEVLEFQIGNEGPYLSAKEAKEVRNAPTLKALGEPAITAARKSSGLTMSSIGTIGISGAASTTTAIPRNTFYGDGDE